MTPKKERIPVEFFHQIMEYREEEVDGVLQGNVYWKYREDVPKEWNTRFAGKKVGNMDTSRGYYRTSILYNENKYPIRIHTIVFILNKNKYPDGPIDHIDRNKKNNLFKNLEDGTIFDNANNIGAKSNRTSHFRAVSRKNNKWRVCVRVNSMHNIHYGLFTDELEAAQIANKALIENFGHTKNVYQNDISMGYTNQEYPNMPRNWVPEEVAA